MKNYVKEEKVWYKENEVDEETLVKKGHEDAEKKEEKDEKEDKEKEGKNEEKKWLWNIFFKLQNKYFNFKSPYLGLLN